VIVQACSEKSVTFGFRISPRPEGEPGTSGEITCVAIDAGWRSIALRQEWRERLLGPSRGSGHCH
jgi:acyl-CoA thioesterase FadM